MTIKYGGCSKFLVFGARLPEKFTGTDFTVWVIFCLKTKIFRMKFGLLVYNNGHHCTEKKKMLSTSKSNRMTAMDKIRKALSHGVRVETFLDLKMEK